MAHLKLGELSSLFIVYTNYHNFLTLSTEWCLISFFTINTLYNYQRTRWGWMFEILYMKLGVMTERA